MHPIDCIKTLQQSNAGAGLSMVGASRTIFKTQGLGGFYSGVGTYVGADGIAGSIKFATYEAIKGAIKKVLPKDEAKADAVEKWSLFAAAGAAFIASSVVLVPGELIKQRLQMGQIPSVAAGIKQIWTQEGPLGFFTGYAGVCYRDVPYTMLELGLYDNLKSLYLKYKNRSNAQAKPSQIDEIVCAAFTGGITGYLTNPLDIVKTKIMTDSALYTGFPDAFRKQVAAGGVSSLFQGGAARVMWLMPFTAIYLPVYEEIKRKLAARRGAGSGGITKIRGGGQVTARGTCRGGVCYI